MSHFSVLVIGDEIEKQLAPYQENNMGDCPKEYLRFNEDEDSEVDEETGKRGYWENPNRKWDYYRIGGRWAGHWKLRVGAKAPAPTPGYEIAFGQELPAANTADQARKCDIDFEGMRGDAAHDAAINWDYAAEITAGTPPHRPWSEMKDETSARELYWAQPRLVAWKNATKNMSVDERRRLPMDPTWENPDDYLVSREQYIQSARNRAGITFAVVKDGKWYERGEMGWWGVVIGEKDHETWQSMFQNLLDALPPETLLTVVDCHI